MGRSLFYWGFILGCHVTSCLFFFLLARGHMNHCSFIEISQSVPIVNGYLSALPQPSCPLSDTLGVWRVSSVTIVCHGTSFLVLSPWVTGITSCSNDKPYSHACLPLIPSLLSQRSLTQIPVLVYNFIA